MAQRSSGSGEGSREQGAGGDGNAGDVRTTGCGLLVDYDDAGQLAEAIARLLADDGLRSSMGAAGRERVRKEFNWDGVTDRILDIYRELAPTR